MQKEYLFSDLLEHEVNMKGKSVKKEWYHVQAVKDDVRRKCEKGRKSNSGIARTSILCFYPR